MKRIKNLQRFMKGRTVAKVNDHSANVTNILFTDGSAMCFETERVMEGIYTPAPYRMTKKEYERWEKEKVK